MLLTVDGLDVPAEELAAEDGRLMLLLHVVYNDGTSGVTFLTEHQARISLLDIRTYDPDGHQKSLVAEGFWRLEFELKPPEKEARAIVLHDVMLPAIYLNLQEVIDNIDTEIQ